MDVHPPKNGINRYWSIPIYISSISQIYHPHGEICVKSPSPSGCSARPSTAFWEGTRCGARGAKSEAGMVGLWFSHMEMLYIYIYYTSIQYMYMYVSIYICIKKMYVYKYTLYIYIYIQVNICMYICTMFYLVLNTWWFILAASRFSPQWYMDDRWFIL